MSDIKIHVLHTSAVCVAPDLPFGGDLVTDRSIWFEVFISVVVTADARRFLRDTEKDWNRGTGKYHAVVKREFIQLN